jgi:hypothetical protein
VKTKRLYKLEPGSRLALLPSTGLDPSLKVIKQLLVRRFLEVKVPARSLMPAEISAHAVKVRVADIEFRPLAN